METATTVAVSCTGVTKTYGAGQSRDHLVDVHVRAGARPRLEHVHRKLVSELTRRDALRDRFDRCGTRGIEQAGRTATLIVEPTAEAFVREIDRLRDPVLRDARITVTVVDVSPDLRNATAFIVPLGGEHADDRHDHQQLDERETTSSRRTQFRS